MTVELFLILLTAFSTATSLATEAVKKFLDSAGAKYASDLVVLAVSALIGGCGTMAYYVIADVALNATSILCILLMIVANWFGAMVGYDKVTQAITQFKKK
jgi:hypothetical protein